MKSVDATSDPFALPSPIGDRLQLMRRLSGGKSRGDADETGDPYELT
jgi:hypothetical protein